MFNVMLFLGALSCVAEEFVAYPTPISTMRRPFAASCGSLDGPTGNWSQRFAALLETHKGNNTTAPTKFEALYGMGNQKSGTTSFARAAQRLGYKERVGLARKVGRGYKRNFYQDGRVPIAQVEALQGYLQRSSLFEDDPWFVLYRLADFTFRRKRKHVGFVLTLRRCDELAESSAAYNNPGNGKGGNSQKWNAEHCARHYKRCHVHLLDVYNFLEERGQWRPLDDVLVIETDESRSEDNWHRLVDFACLGSTNPGAGGDRACLANKHKFATMPQANARSTKSKRRVFCPATVLAPLANRQIGGDLIQDLPPQPPNHAQCAKRPSLAGCKEMHHVFR